MTTLEQYRASAPVGVLELRCLEISHPTFSAPLRVYTPGYQDLVVTLEGGSTATFKACAFRTAPPARDDSGRVSRSLQIDGVDGSLKNALLLASQSADAIVATMRIYLSNELGEPQFDPPETLTLTSVNLSKSQITAQAENEDIINRRFPAAQYTTDNTPGLKR